MNKTLADNIIDAFVRALREQTKQMNKSTLNENALSEIKLNGSTLAKDDKNDVVEEDFKNISFKYDNGNVDAEIDGRKVDWSDEKDVKALHDYVDDVYTGLFNESIVSPFFNGDYISNIKKHLHKTISDNYHATIAEAPNVHKEDDEKLDDKKKHEFVMDYIDSIDVNNELSDTARNNIKNLLVDFIDHCNTFKH